jgi:hypothetical protein
LSLDGVGRHACGLRFEKVDECFQQAVRAGFDISECPWP